MVARAFLPTFAIESGKRSERMVSNMDLYSTILDYAGLPDTQNPATSRSLVPLFTEDAPDNWGDDAVYSEQEETRVVRTPKYVLFKRYSGENNQGISDELYDVEQDPQETINLSGDPEFESIEKKLNNMLQQYFQQNAIDNADLWTGGVPIQNSMRIDFWQGIWGDQWEPVYSYTD